jgi:hypothetical protein
MKILWRLDTLLDNDSETRKESVAIDMQQYSSRS